MHFLMLAEEKRVLICALDERTCYQLKNVIHYMIWYHENYYCSKIIANKCNIKSNLVFVVWWTWGPYAQL